MLQWIVRFATLVVTLFMGVIAFLYLVAEEEDFPNGTDYAISLSFTTASATKQQIFEGITSAALADHAILYKVVAHADDFYNGRSLFQFGKPTLREKVKIDWMTPERYGVLHSAETIGFGSVDGRYAAIGDADLSNLQHYVSDVGGHLTFVKRSFINVMASALVNTGAWLPVATCMALSITLAITWGVQQSRTRTLCILNGARTISIITNDLVSFARILLLYSFLSITALAVIFIVSIGLGHAVSYLSVLITMSAVSTALTLLGSALFTILTWPRVTEIASRKSPERQFRNLTDVLKFTVVFLVAITAPLAVISCGDAAMKSSYGLHWERMHNVVSLRVFASDPGVLESRESELGELAMKAEQANSFVFSYYFAPETLQLPLKGFDGISIVNPRYLQIMGHDVGSIDMADVPSEVLSWVTESFDIWSVSGSFEENGYLATASNLPSIEPKLGEMHVPIKSLLIVLDTPGTLMERSFLSSTITSGNAMFESDWIAQHLNGSAASDLILSVDKVADAGLERAQSSALTAVTRLISLALEVVSLIALAGVSALIYCFKSAQRIFVQRTSGLCWVSIFRARLLVDVATCCIVTIGITVFEPKMFWLGIVFSLTYLLISSTLHMASGKLVFRRILNRNL